MNDGADSQVRDFQSPGGFSRRRLLESLGLASGSLFLPSLLGDKRAYAQGAAKRIVIFTTGHGPPLSAWGMRRPGLPDKTATWEYPFDDADPNSWSEVLRVLHPHRKELLVLDGLAYTSAILDKQGNGHGDCMNHQLTGAIGGKGPSFDQYIAQQVAVPGRFKYLYYGSNHGEGAYDSRVRDINGVPIPMGAGINVGAAYDRIFGSLGMAAAPAGPLTPADIARQRDGNLVGFVKSQYAAVLPKLSSEDRLKLGRHRDMLADLESQVLALKTFTCAKPAAVTGNQSDMFVQGDTFLSKFYAIAMACDLTRVAHFNHRDFTAAALGAPGTKNVHDDIAHSSDDANGAKQESIWMKNYYQLNAKQFSNMITAFKSVPEGNGTMLDNSVLVWIPEMSNGAHNKWDLRIVMAGGCGGAFRTGRYIKFAETGGNPGQAYPTNNGFGGERGDLLGPAHSKLLVSLMQAMGVNKNSIGVEKAVSGSGYGMPGPAGVPIDLTGPIAELK